MQEMQQVWFLSQEDSLEEEMEPIPVFLPGKSHGQRRLVNYIQSTGLQRVGHNWVTKQQQIMIEKLEELTKNSQLLPYWNLL